MAFHYTTAAKVRRYDAMLSTADFTDAIIESMIDDHAQPLVDTMLEPAGYTIPFTEDDTGGVISTITAMIAASELITGDIAQFAGADLPDKSERLFIAATDWLDAIIAGDRYLSHTRTADTVGIYSDPTPSVRPADEIIVGATGELWTMPEEEREIVDKKIYLAYTSDPHHQVSGGIANFQTCVTWLNKQAESKSVKALVVGGDLEESFRYDQQFKDFIRAGTFSTYLGENTEGCNLNADIECLPVIGNWDTTSATHDEIPEDPHSIIVGRYPEYFNGKEYYTWDYKRVIRVFVINDITDYTTTAGSNTYFQCNPPGAPLGPPANPDHSGITVAGSDQHTWLDGAFNTDHEWKIMCFHRPLWSARDNRDGSRRSNRVAREYLAPYIDRRLSLILSGDQHIGSLSGPWYPAGTENAQLKGPGQLGTYELIAAGGYFPRPIIPGSLPDEERSILWSSGQDATSHHIAHMVLLGFAPGSNVCDITIFEVTDEAPDGSVVYNGKLVQNRGA